MAEQGAIALTGCAPEPVLSYLKAMGVLRLVSEQLDPLVRGCWQRDVFVLHTEVGEPELSRFFLHDYRPTPVIACWNGGSGFFPKDNDQAISTIAASQADRWATYRQVIAAARALLQRLGIADKPAGDDKLAVLAACRNQLPDEGLPWLDAAFVLTDEKPGYPPILGTGGNDGRLDFTNNFMQRLLDVLPTAEGAAPPKDAAGWLQAALFGGSESPALVQASVGQYHPGGVGGPNATQGFEGGSLVNPWDFVLMIEGALLFAGSVARRLGSSGRARAAFPFTVDAVAAGYGTAVDAEYGDAARAEAEIWLPLWQKPAGYAEVARIFAEGRAQWGRRGRWQARSGTDFARAVMTLGVDRGITEFQRVGIVQRSGKAHLMTPLARVPVVPRPQANLLADLDPWLDRLRAICRSSETPERYRRHLREIERAILSLAYGADAAAWQAIVVALGRIGQGLAANPRFRDERGLTPLHLLTPGWLAACDDDSPEFRLAVALASIRAPEPVGPIRQQLEPVVCDRQGNPVWRSDSRPPAWADGPLPAGLAAVLERRCLEQLRARKGEDDAAAVLPLSGLVHADLADVYRLLSGQVDDQRLAALLRGLATVQWHRFRTDEHRPDWQPGPLPIHLARAYALLKLLFLPRPLRLGGREEVRIRPEPRLLALLRAGDVGRAAEIAVRRLRASDLRPLVRRPQELTLPTGQAERLAAALLVPINQEQTLARWVLRVNSETSDDEDERSAQ